MKHAKSTNHYLSYLHVFARKEASAYIKILIKISNFFICTDIIQNSGIMLYILLIL